MILLSSAHCINDTLLTKHYFADLSIQWKPLNVIRINVISCLLWSDMVGPILVYYQKKVTAYCYHLVNVVSLAWSHSDHIKRLPLYKIFNCSEKPLNDPKESSNVVNDDNASQYFISNCSEKPLNDPKESSNVVDDDDDNDASRIVNFPIDDPKNRIRYEGSLKEGLPNRRGTMIWKSGGSYSGNISIMI